LIQVFSANYIVSQKSRPTFSNHNLNKNCLIPDLYVIERWFRIPTSPTECNCLTLENIQTLKIMNLASNCWLSQE